MISFHISYHNLQSHQQRLHTQRCINLSATRKATFLAESSSSRSQATWNVLQAESFCCFWTDSAQTDTSFDSSSLPSQIHWPGGFCPQYKHYFECSVFAVIHTFCRWLISLCLVWRATKAGSCSVCSRCSSTASCVRCRETRRCAEAWDSDSGRPWTVSRIMLLLMVANATTSTAVSCRKLWFWCLWEKLYTGCEIRVVKYSI